MARLVWDIGRKLRRLLSLTTGNVVFYQQFTGDGSDTTFQLTTGGVANATWLSGHGAWAVGNIQTTYSSHATGTNKKPIYDSLVPLTRNRISVSSINASGLATLSHAPRNGVDFYIWYWYQLDAGDVLSTYYREDFVASMEGEMIGMLRLLDTNSSNSLTFNWDEDDDTDRVLKLKVGGADRTLEIPTPHNDLASIQGGSATERQHFTTAQHTEATRKASAAQSGLITELATEAEVQAGTDNVRAVTPKGVNDRTATEARTGIAELATNAEALAGSDADRVLTPDDLKHVLDRRNINLVNLLGNSGFGVWSNSDTNKGLSRGTPTENVSVDSGSTLPVVGETLTGATSGALGKVISVINTGGNWGANTGTATLSMGACTGRFQNDEDLDGSAGGGNICTLNMPPTAAGVDLIRNGDFTADEDPPQGWGAEPPGQTTLTTEGAGKVGNCLMILEAGGGNSYAIQTFTVTAGKLYKLTCYVKAGTEATYRVILWDDDNSANIYDTGDTEETAGDWSTSVICTFVAPSGCSNVKIFLYGRCAIASNKTMYYDEVSLYEITPCCTGNDTLGLDGWQKDAQLHLYRQHNDGGTYTKDGSFYSLKTVSHTADRIIHWPLSTIYSNAEFYQQFAGKSITLGLWAKTGTASHIRLHVYDGASVYSSYHTGGGAWEWLEVTKAISTGPSQVNFRVRFTVADAIAYISQPMLVFGSSIGEGNYVQMPEEVVNVEKNIPLTDYVASDDCTADTIINAEAQAEAMIPKGAKVLCGWWEAENSATDKFIKLLSESGGVECARIMSIVAAKEHSQSFRVICDAAGDFYIDVEDANWDNLTIEVTAIQVA